MVTQLLFGELFAILAWKEKWICIKTSFDDYECWIDAKQVQLLYEEVYQSLLEAKTSVATDLVQVMKNNETGHVFPIVAGSSLPHLRNNILRIDKSSFTYDGAAYFERAPHREEIAESGYLFLNSPYLWGGRSPFGIDCSGFVQVVYKMNGIRLPRDAWQQAAKGVTRNFIEEAEEGDVAFFDNKEGKIVHTGIILRNNKIIHASGRVRVDSFDHNGIFNIEQETYTHKLRIIKSFI